MRSVLENQDKSCGSMAPIIVCMLVSCAGTLELMSGSRCAMRLRSRFTPSTARSSWTGARVR